MKVIILSLLMHCSFISYGYTMPHHKAYDPEEKSFLVQERKSTMSFLPLKRMLHFFSCGLYPKIEEEYETEQTLKELEARLKNFGSPQSISTLYEKFCNEFNQEWDKRGGEKERTQKIYMTLSPYIGNSDGGKLIYKLIKIWEAQFLQEQCAKDFFKKDA